METMVNEASWARDYLLSCANPDVRRAVTGLIVMILERVAEHEASDIPPYDQCLLQYQEEQKRKAQVGGNARRSLLLILTAGESSGSCEESRCGCCRCPSCASRLVGEQDIRRTSLHPIRAERLVDVARCTGSLEVHRPVLPCPR